MIRKTLQCLPATDGEEVLEGSADGFGGIVTVKVTKVGDKITKVEVVGNDETDGIGTNAIEQLPAKIIEANSTTVDVISEATVTSKAIIDAVNNAIDPVAYPYPTSTVEKEPDKPAEITANSVFQGAGIDNSGRVGPGKDAEEVPVYTFNQIFTNALFDADGKILSIYVDQLEVATPNYESETMPKFSGFPTQGGYNNDGTITGKTEDTDDNFLNEISTWKTKREHGDDYKMTTGTWASQMDNYQKLFVGKTVAEIEQWFNDYCSEINGRPLKADSTNPEDVTKFEALSTTDQEMLVDVVSGATMSLNDSHGNIVASIKDAYENKSPITVDSIGSVGIGVASSGRLGPGKDAQEVSNYSINEIISNTVFDKDGKIVAVFVDQLEILTPNSSSETAPHFSGFPGQGGFNLDANHDKTITGKTPDTEEYYLSEFKTWTTKRDRGDSYKMTTGTWADQMNKYQEVFTGKTTAEVEDWYNKYSSTVNGRPLRSDSENPEDVTRFEALSADEQTMLVDVITAATMSINDSHGNFIDSINNSWKNKVDASIALN